LSAELSYDDGDENKKRGVVANLSGGFHFLQLVIKKKANSCFTLMLDINTKMMFST